MGFVFPKPVIILSVEEKVFLRLLYFLLPVPSSVPCDLFAELDESGVLPCLFDMHQALTAFPEPIIDLSKIRNWCVFLKVVLS